MPVKFSADRKVITLSVAANAGLLKNVLLIIGAPVITLAIADTFKKLRLSNFISFLHMLRLVCSSKLRLPYDLNLI
ncbi:MAG: hypothetical protein P1V21_12585 [Rhizobiaceae bacterium]|nr:hypothetical protein [Rhizobiaceae bacterium]